MDGLVSSYIVTFNLLLSFAMPGMIVIFCSYASVNIYDQYVRDFNSLIFSMQVLNHLLYLMRVAEKTVQRRVALALAHLCSPDDQRTIFIDNNGMSNPQ